MTVGENILKYWKYYAIISAMITLGGWLYTRGGVDKDIENRIFKSKELKYETEKYMEEKPSAAQEQRAYILDSINKTSAIISRAKRDSTYKAEVEARMEEAKARRKTDSIVLLNADQLYQIKEELKKLNNN